VRLRVRVGYVLRCPESHQARSEKLFMVLYFLQSPTSQCGHVNPLPVPGIPFSDPPDRALAPSGAKWQPLGPRG
jgi:hypothetical protein